MVAQRAELQAKASRAQEEWHGIESDLYHVKSAHLEALQELRTAREAQVQTERELTERVAELSDELRERTEELDLTVDALEEKEKECEAKEEALQTAAQEADVSEAGKRLLRDCDRPPPFPQRRAAAKVEHARKELDRDYVSRSTVRQMEKVRAQRMVSCHYRDDAALAPQLYDQALSRLVRRVEELERRNGGGQAASGAASGAETTDSEVAAADRKLAEVGRRPPPGRRPQAHMQRASGPARRGARGGQSARLTASTPSLPAQGLGAYRGAQGMGAGARGRSAQPRRWAAPRGSGGTRGRTTGAAGRRQPPRGTSMDRRALRGRR